MHPDPHVLYGLGQTTVSGLTLLLRTFVASLQSCSLDTEVSKVSNRAILRKPITC